MDYINELINKKFNTDKGFYYFIDLIKEKYPYFKINEANLETLIVEEIPEEDFLKHGSFGIYYAKTNTLKILKNISKFNINITEDELIETFLHELIHVLTSYVLLEEDKILEGINYRRISDKASSFFLAINEGITQYIVNDLLNLKNSDAYIFETHIAKQLSLIIGKEKLLTCYSNNDFEGFIKALQAIDREFDVRKFVLDTYSEYLVLINAFASGDKLEDKRRVAIIEDNLLELYLKTSREYDQEFLDSLFTYEEADRIINFEESVEYYGRQDISNYGLMDAGSTKDRFSKMLEERDENMEEVVVYENKKEELLANGLKIAQELELRIKSGKVIKDIVDDDGERIIVTETELGTYGYQVFERGDTEPHYFAEGYYLIDDLTKSTDSDGVALRYTSAKSRIQRNLVGTFIEYIKDQGFHSLYVSQKYLKDNNIQVSQRMTGYTRQDPVTLLSFQFDRREVSIAADAQIVEKGGKMDIRIGMGAIKDDGTIDYDLSYKIAMEAERAKKFFGESNMSREKLTQVMLESSQNAQSLLYGVYQSLGLPILDGVTPSNLLAEQVMPMLPDGTSNKLN